ncbi:DUF6233 domain-containing protein [Streptomyces sp. NPDC059340]|uniref:DUF6233 domain-containing protein n=1 Tax=Streptomyces sp. NPDC059340 TaxID=3346806 RepID=UPI0036746D6F
MARLLTLRVWHAMWLQRIDTKIADLQEREAEQEQGRKNRPQEPDWIVELGIGNGRPPIEVHAGGCYAAGKRRRSVPRDEVARTKHCPAPPRSPAGAPRPHPPAPRHSASQPQDALHPQAEA